MRFNKSQLYPAVCLVSLVFLHLVTAQSDNTAIEAMLKMEMEKFELKMMQLLRTYLHYHNSHVEQEYTCELEFQKVQNISDAQHKKVLEKVASHGAAVERIAGAISNLRENDKYLLAGQSELRKQMTSLLASSCATLNVKETNTYYIRPYGTTEKPFLVLCDFGDNFKLGGGWTVFQSRFNGSVNFYQNWTMYRNGFGDVAGEHWLGLEKLHAMTRTGRHELLVLLEDFEGNSTYALYDDFKIGSETEKYQLTVGKYSGTAGDSLTYHNRLKFSTLDQDNDLSDSSSCAIGYTGAWWFRTCYYSHLNGKYFQKEEHLQSEGVDWNSLGEEIFSLKSTKMMFRSRS